MKCWSDGAFSLLIHCSNTPLTVLFGYGLSMLGNIKIGFEI